MEKPKEKRPIRFDDRRYFEARYQEFETFEEGERFLRDYCNQCRIKKNCRINYELRLAMGNNYFYFSDEFVRLTACGVDSTDIDTFESPERPIISCKKFKPKQLEFVFAE